MNAREFAAQLGLYRSGREWRGNCPACGYRDAFVLADGKHGPIAWCASCHDQTAITQALGGSYTPPTPALHARDTQARLERAQRLWRGAEPLPGTAAATYLDARGVGHVIGCVDLRFHADCPHPSRVRLPALVAAVRDVDDKFVGIHRTFLRRDGSAKAEIEPAKASLGSVRGGAVRLASIEQVLGAGELVVAEGIETAASAGLLFDLPAWAAISAGNLAQGLVLPTIIRKVMIAADGDSAGQDAADAAWRRWHADGCTVHIATPDEGVGDFNDIAREERA
jgi:phage/plasmid primase-like uncharacterized protein